MPLEDSLRLLRFTPSPRMEVQHTMPTATDRAAVAQHVLHDNGPSHGIIDDIGEVGKEQLNKADQEHGSAQQDAEQQESAKSNPMSQDTEMSDQSSDSEYVPSQESESSTTEQLEREKESASEDTEGKEEEEEEPEEHIDLDYQIPEETLRAAMLAPPNTRASFWSAKMYRGPEGQPPATHYCRTMEVAERVAQYFLKEKVLGFDIEWKPYGHPNSIKQNASLIQLACEDRIALFHIALFQGSTPKDLMPPTLKAILESPEIYKVGVAVKGDFSRLRKFLGIEAQGVFELSRLHNLVEWHATDSKKVTNKLIALAAQVLQHLQLPLYKGAQLADDPADTANVRSSDWSKPLDLQQVHYAAADTYAGFRLYHILEWKRKQLRPTPPTRGICDYDATPAPRSPKASKKRTAKSKVDSKVAAEQSASEVESEQNLEQQQEVMEEEEEDDEEQTYETAPEDSTDSLKLEGPISPSLHDVEQGTTSHDSTADEHARARKRVGRVNLSWLRGPDPGYPILPQEPDEHDTSAAPSDPLANPANCVNHEQNVAHSSQTRLPNLEMVEDDEFADPELENALQVLDLDADGKLTDHTDASVTMDVFKSNPHTEFALGHTDPDPRAFLRGRDQDKESYAKKHEPTIVEAGQLATSSSPPLHTPAVTADDTHTPEYHLATAWAQNYFQSTIPSPKSTATSRVRATIPHLRSYHLWYHQSLSLDEIAGHLRDPPLTHSTVAGYVLQAVTLERLDYDKNKMRDMMMSLPTGLRQGRWKGMAEKVGASK
jgi:hypothetical protein